MKTITKIISIFLLFISGTVLTSCSGDDKESIVPPPKVIDSYTLSINATRGVITRTLIDNGTCITASWSSNDIVKVFKNEIEIGTLKPESEGTTTTLKGKVKALVLNDELTLKFLSPDYSNQDGTLAGIDSKCNYATAKVKVSSIKNADISTTNATFDNYQAITKFTFSTAIKSVVISGGMEEVTVTPATATTTIYVALPLTEQETTYNFIAYDEEGNEVRGSQILNLDKGKYYDLNIRVAGDPLTLEAIEDGVITIKNPLGLTIKYTINGGEVTDFNTTTDIIVSTGDKVHFWGDNKSYATNNSETSFFCSNKCYIYGNIMSLINSRDYDIVKELTEENSFKKLFAKNINIDNHPNKRILLPATKLVKNCYWGMFWGCSNLTHAPNLPSMNLAEGCYTAMFSGCTNLEQVPKLPATKLYYECYCSMFEGCTNLTNAPELPATTLSERCYDSMFKDCTNLTNAPNLSAKTLAEYSYWEMFSGCTSLIKAPSISATFLGKYSCVSMFKDCLSLSEVPELFVKELAEGCCQHMFQGCSSLKKAPDLPAIVLANACYTDMFANCSSLTSPPKLPATTLAEGCYANMFYGCTSLTRAPELPATILADDCYNNMFQNCSNLIETPQLPAVKLAKACYRQMFSLCTKLTISPQLSATNLAEDCYGAMFWGCTNLTEAPELPATELAEWCYALMFYQCSNISIAPELPAVTLKKGCYSGMFQDCVNLKTAPDLLATSLVEYCYQDMFRGCVSLKNIKCLATDLSAESCTHYWLYHVAPEGIFVKSPKVYYWRQGDPSGIPYGWRAVDAE